MSKEYVGETDPVCSDCYWCDSVAFHTGHYYCWNPDVKLFEPVEDLSKCFRPFARARSCRNGKT